MLTKFRRGRRWYLRGTVRGVNVYETTRTSDESAAEILRIKRESEILHRTIHGERGSHSFKEAALMYLERPGGLPDTEARYVFPLVDHFGQLTLDRIDQADIDRYIATRHRGAKVSTIQRATFTPLTSILNHAHGLGWCDVPRFRRPKQPKGRTAYLSEAQAEQLIKAAAPHIRPLVITLLYTGARLSEVLYLDWRDVDLQRRTVTFWDTKNDDPRTVPLHERAFLALANMPHRDGAVFRSRRGEPYARRRMGGGQVTTAWRGACKRAGLADMYPLTDAAGRPKLDKKGEQLHGWRPWFSPHTLRHTFASWLVMSGAPLRTVAELLGHKSLSMVMRYSHLSEDHQREHVASLPSGAKSGQSEPRSGKGARSQ